jgi:hypothetical protein
MGMIILIYWGMGKPTITKEPRRRGALSTAKKKKKQRAKAKGKTKKQKKQKENGPVSRATPH